MAHFVATDQRLYVDQYDLSGDVTTNGPTFTQDAVNATTHGNNSMVYLPGLRSASYSVAGYADFAADANFDALNGNTTLLVTMTPDGDTEGSAALVFQSIRTSFTPIAGSIGGMAELSVAGQVDEVFAGGYILHPKTARTSSSQTTGVQVGALNGGTAVANLHVFAGTASTLDVTIESDNSAGFPSATTRGTFTQATGATAEQITITSAGSDDYWRVAYTVGGGTWTFAVSLGII